MDGAFTDALRAADQILLDVFGVDAIYTPASGNPVHTRAVMENNLDLTDDYGTVVQVETAISLPRGNVGEPVHGDTVSVGERVYRVGRIVRQDDLMVTVSAS